MTPGARAVPSATAVTLGFAGAALAAALGALGAGAGALVPPAALVLALAWTRLRDPSRGLEIQRDLPVRWEVGREVRVALTVRVNSGPLRLRLIDGCPEALGPATSFVQGTVGADGPYRFEYAAVPRARGRHRLGRCTVWLERPRGLWRWVVMAPLDDEVSVAPDLRALRLSGTLGRPDLLQVAGQRRRRRPGRDGDFERLRDFVTGDEFRRVDWKATARLDRPIVRVHAEERGQSLLLLLDGTRLMAVRDAGGSRLDHAISGALRLGWVALRRGDRVGAGVFADGMDAWMPPRSGPTAFGALLGTLRDCAPQMAFPRYDEAARVAARALRRRALVVWITDLLDAEQGKGLAEALRALRRRHLCLVIAVDDDDLHGLADRPAAGDERFARAAAEEVLAERASWTRRLEAEGARVVTARPADIGPKLVDAWLEIKARGQL